MREFLKISFLFLLFPLTVILLSDFFLRTQNTLHKEKYEGAKEVLDSIEVLILGTSHAHYGVDPEVFDLYAYNLANLGQSIYFDKRITLSLLPEMKKLKYVFIGIGYHSFAFSSQFNKDYWSYYGNGIKYKDTSYFPAILSPTLFGYTPRVAFAMIKHRFSNLRKYGPDILDFEVQNGVDLYKPAIKGFAPFEGRDTFNFNHEAYVVSSTWYTEVIDQSNEKEEIVEDLEDFIEILLTEGITPILFTPPTYTEYNKYLNSSYIKSNKKTSRATANKYGIEYWDFFNSDTFKLEDYYDMEHLNRKGALKFTSMLNDSIHKISPITRSISKKE